MIRPRPSIYVHVAMYINLNMIRSSNYQYQQTFKLSACRDQALNTLFGQLPYTKEARVLIKPVSFLAHAYLPAPWDTPHSTSSTGICMDNHLL